MRFLAVALFVVAAATCCLANYEVNELEKMAEALRAPFTPNALVMMKQEGHWGENRANRSSDVVIFNAADQAFKLTKAHCMQGKVDENLQPQALLPGKRSMVYGLNSLIYLRGVQCTVLYESSVNQETWFSLMIYTPFFGDKNVASPYSSRDIKITYDATPGNNNQVLITIKNNISLRSSLSSGGRSLQKSKRSRSSKFYKNLLNSASGQY